MNNEIGFYKYGATNGVNYEFIHPYPIDKKTLENLKKNGNIKYEFENNKLKKINGKLVVII